MKQHAGQRWAADVWQCCCAVEGHGDEMQEHAAASAHKAPVPPYPVRAYLHSCAYGSALAQDMRYLSYLWYGGEARESLLCLLNCGMLASCFAATTKMYLSARVGLQSPLWRWGPAKPAMHPSVPPTSPASFQQLAESRQHHALVPTKPFCAVCCWAKGGQSGQS